MNRSLLILAAFCLLSSCSVSNSISSAIVGLQTNELISVPVITDTISQTVMGTGSFSYNVDSIIKANTKNALGLNNVDNFQVINCTLTIQNPDSTDNFANFEESQVAFFSNSNSTPLTIVSVSGNPDVYAASLTLPSNNNTNLKSYIASSGPTMFTYSVGGKMRHPTYIVLNVLLHVEYHISVKP